MNAQQFRKKPVVVEAVQLRWTTWNEVCDFLGDIINESNPGKEVSVGFAHDTCGEEGPTYLALDIPTLEGVMAAYHGDWIIKGTQGEFYPCQPASFADTFEAVKS